MTKKEMDMLECGDIVSHKDEGPYVVHGNVDGFLVAKRGITQTVKMEKPDDWTLRNETPRSKLRGISRHEKLCFAGELSSTSERGFHAASCGELDPQEIKHNRKPIFPANAE